MDTRYYICIIIIFALIVIIYKHHVYVEEYDNMREGFYATVMTQHVGFDGRTNRLATHYYGEYTNDGWDIERIDDGIMNIDEVEFIDKFYDNDEGKEDIYRYVVEPELYPDIETIKLQTRVDDSVREAESAELELQKVKKQLEDLTYSESLNEERQNYIIELENQISNTKERVSNLRKLTAFSDILVKLFESVRTSSNVNSDDIDETAPRTFEILPATSNDRPVPELPNPATGI